jgi:uncharacterized protein (TIGR02271 family)
MAKTVIGFFEHGSEAAHVLQDLVDHGFDHRDISLIAHQERGTPEPVGAWAPRKLSVSGVGPVLATGPLATALAEVRGGPTATTLLDVLKNGGVPADEAQWYLEGLHRRGALVAVETDDADSDRAADLMRRVMQPSQRSRGGAGTPAEPSRKGEDMETIERSIDLDVPVQIAYQQWTRFEEFPRFMEGVEEVRRLDGKRLHWAANIGGTRKEWDAQITEEVPDERIAWRSEAGEFTAGVVTFQPFAAERARMTVRFEYEPQGVKETLGDWLGMVSRRVEGDLERFKQFVEARRPERTVRRGTGQASEHAARTTERVAAAPEGGSRFEDYEAQFQQHCRSGIAGRGLVYEHQAPAYRYGYALAIDPRYRGRDWAAVETDARQQWEEHHQGSWAEAKDAVRYAWDTVRGQYQAAEGDVRIPVVEEELQVGKRQVQRGGVRLYTRVTERPVEETVRLRDEEVHVERRPVDRPASEADLAANKEGTIEVTETDEEPVVRKQARVVEEVVVSKDVQEHTETVQDRARRTEVDVEPRGAEHATTSDDLAAYEREFRTHASTAFASRGQAYEHWAPGYRYGYALAIDPQYRGRDWAAVETDARQQWEEHHRGTWDEMKEAIRYGWDKVRGRR